MTQELINIATQAIEYLKENNINKPQFIKEAERVIKNAKKEPEKLDERQEVKKHFDSFLSADGMSYTKIYTALKRALKERPNDSVENVEIKTREGMQGITLITDLEFTTVKRFCEMCGIK
jgi:hypothetical protein